MSEVQASAGKQLRAIIDEYLAYQFRRQPIEASQLGIHEYDNTLGEISAESFAEEAVYRRQVLARLDTIDVASLADDDLMDLHVALIEVKTSLRRLEDLAIWSRAPYWYVEQLGAAFSALLEDSALVMTERGNNLAGRLAEMPRYLAAARQNLNEETAPLHVHMGRTACTGLDRFLASAVTGFAGQLPAGLQNDVLDAIPPARAALADFAGFLVDLGGRSMGTFACGVDHFNFLLREFHLLPYDAELLHAFGLEQMAVDRAQLEATARRLDPNTGWMEQIERIKEKHPQASELLATYRQEKDRAREHCIQHDLVTIPEGEVARVQWLPDYLRAGAPLGLMHTTPPFAPDLTSDLLLTPIDPNEPEDTQRQHLRDHCYAFARSITLHEIYPGHHIQRVHHKLATIHTPIRRYFSSPVFVEGWGLYTEDLMEESDFMTDPAVHLFKLRNALWRSVRVVVDSGLHTRGLSFEGAVDLMCDEVHLDRRMAEGEVRRYTTHDNPTYPSAYLLGKTAIHDLRRRWQAQAGDEYSVKAFHDRLLSYGSPPIALIAERMLAPN